MTESTRIQILHSPSSSTRWAVTAHPVLLSRAPLSPASVALAQSLLLVTKLASEPSSNGIRIRNQRSVSYTRPKRLQWAKTPSGQHVLNAKAHAPRLCGGRGGTRHRDHLSRQLRRFHGNGHTDCQAHPWMRPTQYCSVYPLANAPQCLRMWELMSNVAPHTWSSLQLWERRTTPSNLMANGRLLDFLPNGKESSKGTDVLREAHRLLNQTDLNYLRYVESRDLPEGCADVVVTDGLVGNIVLKLCEGMVTAIFGRIRQSVRSHWLSALIAPALKPLFKTFVRAQLGRGRRGTALGLVSDGHRSPWKRITPGHCQLCGSGP